MWRTYIFFSARPATAHTTHENGAAAADITGSLLLGEKEGGRRERREKLCSPLPPPPPAHTSSSSFHSAHIGALPPSLRPLQAPNQPTSQAPTKGAFSQRRRTPPPPFSFPSLQGSSSSSSAHTHFPFPSPPDKEKGNRKGRAPPLARSLPPLTHKERRGGDLFCVFSAEKALFIARMLCQGESGFPKNTVRDKKIWRGTFYFATHSHFSFHRHFFPRETKCFFPTCVSQTQPDSQYIFPFALVERNCF